MARRNFGLSYDEYDEIMAKGCAICGRFSTEPRFMHLDHDHANDKVRAALCKDCNHGLGGFRDNPALMHAAAAYIEDWRKAHG